jgi:hypothetical protein
MMEQQMNQSQEKKKGMNQSKGKTSRRSLLRKGLAVGGAGAVGASLLNAGLLSPSLAFARGLEGSSLPKGDIDILQFLLAVETIESDFWLQYNELGGITDSEVPGGGVQDNPYKAALRNLDGDMNQYIHDNTDDEFSHMNFLKAYLMSKGVIPVSLEKFRTLKGSTATGVNPNLIGKRLTNLTQLTVDTSWWTRYRTDNKNPDLDDSPFPQAVPDLNKGQHPAIPVTDADFSPPDHIQAIANTAAFHFGFIEQGGTSLYPTLAQGVTNLEVLRILLSIGPTETMHFQTWQDKAGTAVTAKADGGLAPLTDPNNPNLTFPVLTGEQFQPNLIMPEPTIFKKGFPIVSIIRPTRQAGPGGAVATVNAFITDGLFLGQSGEFLDLLKTLAKAADAVTRGGA